MTRRRKIVFMVVAVLVLGFVGLVWLSKGPPEPVYQGKKLSEWLTALNNYYNTHPPAMMISNKTIYPQTAERTEYENAIRQIGTNAIPFLIKMLQGKDSNIKLALADLLGTQNFIKLHITTAAERRIMAFRGFEALGADAEPAVFKLARTFAKSEFPNRTEIGRSLCAILPSISNPGAALFSYPAKGVSAASLPNSTYELSRDDLLEQMGPPEFTGDNYAAYDIGNHSNPMTAGPRFYLYIEFSRDRVLNSFIGTSAERPQMPSIRK